MMTKTNVSKTLRQLISCVCKCIFHGRKCNSNQNWHKEFCLCERKNPIKFVSEKHYIRNPSTCACETDD